MNKIITVFFALCFFFPFQETNAQLKITNTIFHDASYSVYPVRVSSWNGNLSHKRTAGNYVDLGDMDYKKGPKGESFLPYIPFDLPDGRYLAYYPKRQRKFDKITREPIFSHDDTTLVAVTFHIMNNKKEGMVTWYGKDGLVIQTGYYADGLETGHWTLKGGNYVVKYAYLNGLMEGTYERFYKNRITHSKTYVDGSATGTSKTYYKNGQLSANYKYDNSVYVSSVEYAKNGQITLIRNELSPDTISKSFYAKSGKLHTIVRKTNDTNQLEKIGFHENGRLKYKRITYQAVPYKNLQVADSNVKKYLKILDLLNEASNTIQSVSYHDNGQLKYQFDLRTFNEDSKLLCYDHKGKVERELTQFLMPADTNRIWVKDYQHRSYLYGRNKRKYLAIEKIVSDPRRYEHNITYVGAKGEITEERSADFLNYYYADSVGIAHMATNTFKKRKTEIYSILHTNLEVHNVSRKDNVYENFTYGKVGEDELMFVVNQWSKDGQFKVEHRKTVNTKKPGDMRNYRTNKIFLDKLQRTYDSLDYTVYYKNEAFQGTIKVINKTRSEHFEFKSKFDKRHKRRYHLNRIELKLFDADWDDPEGHSTVYNGRIFTMLNDDMEQRVVYENNVLDGELIKKNGVSKHFAMGQLHGLQRYEDRGVRSYYYNKLHGDYYEYNCYSDAVLLKYQPSLKIEYVMDTVHGWFIKYAGPHILKETVYVDKGMPHGRYWMGNVTAPTSILATLEHGFFVDTAFYYYAEGILKVTCLHQLADSEFYAGNTNRDYGFGNGYSLIKPSESALIEMRKLSGHPTHTTSTILRFDANRAGSYTYYYKNGVMSQRGSVKNGYRVGLWEFWDLNGGRMKNISYDTGTYINPSTGDSITYFGEIEMWYPNGKPLLKGLVTSTFQQFKCDQEMSVDFENVYYLSQYDERGNEILKDNSGRVFEYHNNGLLRVEGAIENGKRSGTWKFYDPDGRLEEFGSYKNGLREGLWVKGDLEAVPHFYDRCLEGEVAPFTLPDITQQGYVTEYVKISEFMYHDGYLIRNRFSSLVPLYGIYKYWNDRYGHSEF